MEDQCLADQCAACIVYSRFRWNVDPQIVAFTIDCSRGCGRHSAALYQWSRADSGRDFGWSIRVAIPLLAGL